MTDKQIIDGVDVSGCEFFRVLLPSGCSGRYRCNCDSISTMSLNCEENNCIYKQLKAKEQECEELKEENKEIRKYQYEQDFLQEQLEAYKIEAEEGKEINAELKAENEECIKDNEYLKTIIKDFAQEVVKLKQTLAEIKEIAVDNVYYLDYDYRWILEKILQKIREYEVK